MSLAQIERAIGDFGRRARDGQLKLDELTGGTLLDHQRRRLSAR